MRVEGIKIGGKSYKASKSEFLSMMTFIERNIIITNKCVPKGIKEKNNERMDCHGRGVLFTRA